MGNAGRVQLRQFVRKGSSYFLLCAVSLVTVFPFLWMISTAFKEPRTALIFPPEFIPDTIYWGNFPYLFEILPFGIFILNSFKITVLVVIGRLFVCSLAGFGFARINFTGSTFAFGLLVGSLLIPSAIRIIPMYIIYNRIGWLDTHYPLIIPPIVSSTFGTFLFRQWFMTLPDALEDAARLDGCSTFRIYWNIMMPLTKPVIAALAIFTYMDSWNDFLEPLVYLTRLPKFTIPLGLAFFQGEFSSEYTALMAGSLLSIVPIMAVYTFAQRYFVNSVSLTGLKS